MPIFDRAYFDQAVFDTASPLDAVSVQGVPQLTGDVVLLCSLRSVKFETEATCVISMGADETDANYERQNLTGAAAVTAASQTSDRRVGIIPGDLAAIGLFAPLSLRVFNPSSKTIMPSVLALSGVQSSRVEAASLRRNNITAVSGIKLAISSGEGFLTGSVMSSYFVPKNRITGEVVEATKATVALTIPSGYRDIKITAVIRTDEVAASSGLSVQVNSDATAANYDSQPLSGATSAVGATQTLDTQVLYQVPGASATAGVFSSGVTVVHEYTKTDRHKNFVSMAGLAGERVEAVSTGYSSTDAISTLTFSINGGANILAGSSITVEGIGKTAIGWEDQQVPIDSRVYVDWSDTGTFDGTYDNISSDVVKGSIKAGRDIENALSGKVKAGRLSLTLANDDDRYSAETSPLAGLLLPKRKVQVRSEAPVFRPLFTGHIERIDPTVSIDGSKWAQITCLGVFGQLTQNGINVAFAATKASGAAVTAMLDAGGIASTDYDVDTGQEVFENWSVDDIQLMTGLRRAEESEQGLLRESKDGKVVFEGRSHRQIVPHVVAQAEYSDDPTAKGVITYESIQKLDALRFIFNDFRATVRPKATRAAAPLWTHPEANTTGDAPPIEAGESITVFASHPNPNSGTDVAGVSVWNAMTATTDYQAFSVNNGTGTDLTGSIALVETPFARSKKIVITNNHATLTAYLTKMKNDGTETYWLDPISVRAEDTTSQATYGQRTFTRSDQAVWIPDSATAQEWALYWLSLLKAPSPMLRMKVTGQKSLYHAHEILNRTVSDRIGVEADGKTGLGINTDFFVENYQYDFAPMILVAQFGVSSAAAFSAYWTLGFSILGSETRLNPS